MTGERRRVPDAILVWADQARGTFPFRQTTDLIHRCGTAGLPADTAAALLAARAATAALPASPVPTAPAASSATASLPASPVPTAPAATARAALLPRALLPGGAPPSRPAVTARTGAGGALSQDWFTTRWLHCATAGLAGEPTYPAYIMCDLLDGYCAAGAGADHQENATVLGAALVADMINHELAGTGRTAKRLSVVSSLAGDLLAAAGRKRRPAGAVAATGAAGRRRPAGPAAAGCRPVRPAGRLRACTYLVTRLCRDHAPMLRALLRYSPLPATAEPDEYLFIRAVQAMEVLVGAAAWQAGQAARYGPPDLPQLLRRLAELTANIVYATRLFPVLATIDTAQFAVIRAATYGTGALQSPAFAALERRCGARCALRPEVLASVGVDREPLPDVPLGMALESLSRRLDRAAADTLADAVAAANQAWSRWKRAHHGVTRRIIGDVPGTGGTDGLRYLAAQLDVPLLGRPGPRRKKGRQEEQGGAYDGGAVAHDGGAVPGTGRRDHRLDRRLLGRARIPPGGPRRRAGTGA